MNKLVLMGVVAAGVSAAAFAERQGPWPKEKAWAWHDAQPWYRGCNYMPASAANRVDQWQSYGAGERFAEVEREFALAKEVGFNAMRLIIEWQGFAVWLQEPDAFRANFERYLALMEKYGLKAFVVLGNDCSRPKSMWSMPKLGEQEYDVGYHGGRKKTQHGGFAEPGYLMVDEPEYRAKFFEFCRELVTKYAHDGRVALWELWNEPGAGNRKSASAQILKDLFALCWKIDPDQPLSANLWSMSTRRVIEGKDPSEIEKLALDLSDVITYHGYVDVGRQAKLADELTKRWGRPLYNTEWLLRMEGCEFPDNYAFMARRKIGAFNWGLVNGKYQTHEPYEPMWKSKFEYRGEGVTKWMHDLFRISHHPYDPYEIAVARNVNAQADAELAGTSLHARIAKTRKIVGEDTWYGCRRTKFDFEGRIAWVVEPSTKPLTGNPWTWTMQWAEAYVDRTGVPELLKKGYHHVTIELFDTHMNTNGLKVAAAFQDYLVKELGFSPKAKLIGMSWGGFFSIRYASVYPENVEKIYLDAPLMNFDHFPHVAGGVPKAWFGETPAGGWTTSPEMPINRAEPIAKAGIPILLAYGGEDQTVPPKHNCELFIPRFQAAGGKIEVIKRGLFGHHPHGFDPDKTGPVLKFFGGSNWVNIGSNTGLFGFDWAASGVTGLNLAGSPQSMRRGFAKVKEHRSQIADDAFIIIPMCPFSSVVPLQYDNRASATSHPLLAFDGLPEPKDMAGFRDVLDRCWKREFSIREYSDPMSGENRAAFHVNVRTFREFFAWCRNEKLRPVLILPPAARCFDGLFPPSFMKAYVYDFIAEVKQPEVPFIDYWNVEDLRIDRNFANALFLNRTGRLTFTKRVMADVQKAK